MKKTYPDPPAGITIIKNDDIANLVDQVADSIVDKLEQRYSKKERKTTPVPGSDTMELIPKVRACEILQRCDSTLSKWAASGKLVPVRRGGSLYYMLSDVMRVYNGEQ